MLHTPFLDNLMPIITRLGNRGILWIIIAVIFLCTKKYRTTGIIMLSSLAISSLIGNDIIKPLIGRERPYVYREGYQLLIPPPQGFSFPSGHTISSFTASTVIFLRHRKIGTVALCIAALIAFSRLYLYVHFPSDVLGGLIMGVLIGILCSHMFRCKTENSTSME